MFKKIGYKTKVILEAILSSLLIASFILFYKPVTVKASSDYISVGMNDYNAIAKPPQQVYPKISQAISVTTLGTNQDKVATSPWTALSSLSLTDGDYVIVGDSADTATSQVITTTNAGQQTSVGGGTNAIWGSNMLSQTFISSATGHYTMVSLYISKSGTPINNLTVAIKAVDGSHKPTGSALSSTTIAPSQVSTTAAWVTVIMGTITTELSSSTEYAVQLSSLLSDNSNYYIWTRAASDVQASWYSWASSDSGGTWSSVTEDFGVKNYVGANLIADVTATNAGAVVTKIWSGKIKTTATDWTIEIVNTSTAKAMTAIKASGLSSSNALDAVGLANSTGTGVNASAGPTGTLTQTNELAVAVTGVEDEIDDAHGTFTTGASYISGNEQFNATNGGSDSTNVQVHSVAEILSATTAQSVNDTAHDSTNWAAAIATYRMAIGAPTSFTSPSQTTSSIYLTWTLGEGATSTQIRYQEGSYPADNTSGTQAYFSTGTSVNVTSLSAGTTYYFRAWGYNTGSALYSSATANLTQATTSSGANYSANQTTYNFGVVVPGSTTNTSSTWILFANTSSVSTNISVKMLASTWTSAGTGWTHSDSAAGANTAAMKAASGNVTNWSSSVFIKYNAPFNEIGSNIAANSNYLSGLSLLAPTSVIDGYANNNTVRFSFYSSS